MSQARQALRLRAEVPAEVPHTAMIMAAGLGKRMRPLTATRPKPLIEVNGKALLDHVLEKLRAAGVRKVVVNVHYLADALEAHLASRAHGLEVVISDERDLLLETGGGLVRAEPLIEVGGKALLDHVLDRLRVAGVRKVVVNVHYLADALEARDSRQRDDQSAVVQFLV